MSIYMRKVKVLVVDDSAFMLKAIPRIIESDDAFKVVATANDGVEALKMIKRHRPEVITLDVEMPKMNGVETLKEIRKQGFLTPVIMVSSITRFGADIAIRCLEAGAFDIVRKPESYVSMDIHKISRSLISKLKAAVNISSENGLTTTTPSSFREELKAKKPKLVLAKSKTKATGGQKVITIGSSTGGPSALQKILSRIPADIGAGLVIVQHMPEGNFIQSLAERLDAHSAIDLRVAKDGDIIQDGVAFIAKIGKHVVFEQWNNTYKIHLTRPTKDNPHCPSADALFKSAGEVIGSRNISCILTGMGSDGARGLEYVYKNGGYIVAEAEESCVVYGMPRSAVETGYVNKISTLDKIPNVLLKTLNSHRAR